MSPNSLKTMLAGALICAAIAFSPATATADVIIIPPRCTAPAFKIEAKPVIKISTLDGLRKIGRDAAYPLNGHYVLTNDIDASASKTLDGGKGFKPIGVEEGGIFTSGFSGLFDGNGHAIRGLYINRPDENGVGLFKGLGANASLAFCTSGEFQLYLTVVPEIRNLTVEIDTVIGRHHVGGLVGRNDGGKIDNCNVEGTVIAVESTVGGLAGSNDLHFADVFGMSADFVVMAAIKNSRSAADVRSLSAPMDGCGGNLAAAGGANCAGDFPYAYAGGLVGYNDGDIINSRATGSVSGIKGAVGGLAGYNQSGWFNSITGSCATGEVSTQGSGAGGLVGINDRGRIFRSYATGTVNAEGSNAGGLVGYSNRAEIADCYARGDVSAVDNIGGLVGYFTDGIAPVSHPAAGLGKRSGAKKSPAPPPPPYVTIRNSYATGKASTISDAAVPRRIGGLVGLYLTSGLHYQDIGIAGSYWDATASGITGSVEGRGESKATAEMMAMSTFKDWNFESVWRIDEGEGYPYLAWQDNNTSISYNNRANRTHTNALMPQISVRGRTLNVKLSSSQQSSPQNLQIRVIDMRGRTVHSRVVNNSVNTLSLTKIPAGRYIVEVKNSGVRVGSVPVVVR